MTASIVHSMLHSILHTELRIEVIIDFLKIILIGFNFTIKYKYQMKIVFYRCIYVSI